MPTDKDLFKIIKETYPLQPSEDFVARTENNLRQMARRINRKKILKQYSLISSGVALCVLAVTWLFAFNGYEVINNHFNSANEGKIVSSPDDEPTVYVYHTHNQESFLPEINVKEREKAWHETTNITLVGNRLSEALKERNISVIQEESDVMGVLKKRRLSIVDAYSVSREVLKDTLENNKNIKMVLDLHRDTAIRKHTTFTYKGLEYARIVFKLSRETNQFEENFKFAEQLNNQLEKDFPGLSRGVFIMSSTREEPITYNQDLLNPSVLIEIGGAENTLEEEYRTVEILAKAIDEYLKINP